MKKLLVALVALAILAVAAGYAVTLFTGPRMTVQPHVRAFQMEAPAPPPGTVTVGEHPPARREEIKPLSASADNLQRGRIYYRYYCVFCHGESGAGNGPVGESYVPVPADLRAEKFRNRGEAELTRMMLSGIGIAPVLERVVPPEHRRYLVLYVKSLPGT